MASGRALVGSPPGRLRLCVRPLWTQWWLRSALWEVHILYNTSEQGTAPTTSRADAPTPRWAPPDAPASTACRTRTAPSGRRRKHCSSSTQARSARTALAASTCTTAREWRLRRLRRATSPSAWLRRVRHAPSARLEAYHRRTSRRHRLRSRARALLQQQSGPPPARPAQQRPPKANGTATMAQATRNEVPPTPLTLTPDLPTTRRATTSTRHHTPLVWTGLLSERGARGPNPRPQPPRGNGAEGARLQG